MAVMVQGWETSMLETLCYHFQALEQELTFVLSDAFIGYPPGPDPQYVSTGNATKSHYSFDPLEESKTHCSREGTDTVDHAPLTSNLPTATLLGEGTLGRESQTPMEHEGDATHAQRRQPYLACGEWSPKKADSKAGIVYLIAGPSDPGTQISGLMDTFKDPRGNNSTPILISGLPTDLDNTALKVPYTTDDLIQSNLLSSIPPLRQQLTAIFTVNRLGIG